MRRRGVVTYSKDDVAAVEDVMSMSDLWLSDLMAAVTRQRPSGGDLG